MNATQHTPGPWYPEPDPVFYGLDPTHDNRLIVGGEGLSDIICRVSDNNQKANAHLIAAAPELLEALDTLTEYFEEQHGQTIEDEGEGHEDDCSYCRAIREAKKAIEKARGE